MRMGRRRLQSDEPVFAKDKRTMHRYRLLAPILGISALLGTAASASRSPVAARTEANVMVEIAFTASQDYRDAFHEVTLDALFETPQGRTLKVPAFWAGGRTWKVRYASPAVGAHRWRSVCSVPADRGLHGLTGTVTVETYRGENPLYLHGPLRVAADLLEPFMPTMAAKLVDLLNVDAKTLRAPYGEGLKPGHRVKPPIVLFPRIDKPKA